MASVVAAPTSTSLVSEVNVAKLSTLAISVRETLVPADRQLTVRTVGVSQYREAALSLAHAFASDELSIYLLSPEDMAHLSAERRWELHVNVMAYMTAAHCLKGLVTTIGPECDSVALWMPPGAHMEDWVTLFRSGMWKLYFQLSAEGKARFFDELLPVLESTKAEVLGERNNDSYYLVYLGTKSHARGKGYAAALLRNMMARADAEGRAMYLESGSQANNAFYRKFGFRFVKDIFLQRGNAPVGLSIMVREPHSTILEPRRRVAVVATD